MDIPCTHCVPIIFVRTLQSIQVQLRVRVFQKRKSVRSVILAGKQDSRRYFTAIFCENDVVAQTSPQNVGDLVFFETTKGLSYHYSNQRR